MTHLRDSTPNTPLAGVLVLATMLGLTGCAPAPEITSPIGVWEAVGDDNGTLTINDDGTFTMSDASFNPLQYRDTQDNFRGSGDWRLTSDGDEVILRFLEATNDGFVVEPSARRPNFTSGTIRFEDPEQTASIEFRLTDRGE